MISNKNISTSILIVFHILCMTAQEKNTPLQEKFTFSFNISDYTSALAEAPAALQVSDNAPIISLPDENGTWINYYCWSSPVISDEMAEKYPDFKTYIITAVHDNSISGRIFVSRFGIEGLITKHGEQIKIEPESRITAMQSHRVYKLSGFENLSCGHPTHIKNKINLRFNPTSFSNGNTRRVFEIAIVTTGEFYIDSDLGNSDMTTALAAITNIINMDNVRYNQEMAIHFTIFNTPLVYTNPATDPFDPSGNDLVQQSANTIAAAFPTGAYDVGHTLHGTAAGGSGIAGIGVVCSNDATGSGLVKALGWSGGENQTTLAVGIMVHELGHQLGGPHTFNGTGSFCTDQVSDVNAVEIGSGTTIMSYAGLCQSNNNIQSTPDNYFHSRSIENFLAYLGGTGCATTLPSGNTPPTVMAKPCGNTVSIPKLTPFSLSGSATDPDAGQTLTYTWEQIDEDGAGTPTQGFIGTTAGNSNIAPLFRSYPPSSAGNKRIFPSLSTILTAANVSNFEPLPNTARTLNFRLTARDNNPTNGGIGSDDLAVTVSGTAGPLELSSPNTAAVSWATGSIQTITWSVASTNNLCNIMNIYLSTDGGNTFPFTLASNTENDGTQSITLPSNIPGSTMARIKVESNCNACIKFFDISNFNFTITASNCQASVNSICNISPVTAMAGNPALDLSPLSILGNPVTSLTLTTGASTQVSAINTAAPAGAGTCFSVNIGFGYVAYTFLVNTTGTYNFTVPLSIFEIISVYNNTFSASSVCTNFIGSNAFFVPPGSLSASSLLSLPLTACNQYTIVLFRNPGTTSTITITPPAGGLVYGVTNISDYSLTYLAVENTSQNVAAVSNGADFTTLSGGGYCVYGLHYKSGGTTPAAIVNPAVFINQNINDVLASDACMKVSTNCIPMTVTCPTVVTSSGNSGTNTLRDIYDCVANGTTISFGSGVNSNLTAPLTIHKNVTIQGNTTTMIDFNFSGAEGLLINASKTLTLKDVKISLSGTATGPVILNNGNLILNNTEIKGNVNPVINNNGTGNVTLQNSNVIKKM